MEVARGDVEIVAKSLFWSNYRLTNSINWAQVMQSTISVLLSIFVR